MDARKALELWVEQGLIDAELEARLATSLREAERGSRSTAVISVLVSIGALLSGAGLFLFIASHWDSQSPVRRMLVLLGVYLLIVAGAVVCDRARLVTVASGLWFLSAVAVGVNIFLIGQIFNLPLNYWQGTLLWLIATLAVGRAAPSFPLGWMAVVLGLLTLGWLSVPESEFFDQGAFLIDQGGIRPLISLIGLALVAGGQLASGTEADYLVRPARVVGAVFIGVPLVVSTFHPVAFAAVFQIDFRVLHLVVISVCAAVIVALWLRSPHELVAWSLATVGGLLLILLPQVDERPDAPQDLDEFDSLPWLAEPFAEVDLLYVLYGAVIFALAVATVVAGRRYDSRAMVNLGLTAVGVILMATYIGRIAGALPTSVAVLVGGALLVGIAVVLERKRRHFVAEDEVMT